MVDSTGKVIDVQQLIRPRRARVAATVAFATNGALPATLFARYAEVKDALDLNAAVFGLLVVGFAFGASGALHLPGVVLRRLGSRRVASLGTATIALSLVLAATGVVVGSAWLFLVGLLLAGFGDAVVDIAQNAQGLRVQNAYGRSVLSSMHAGWSIGAVVGGVVGTAVASAGIPLSAHLAAWGILCTATMVWSARSFLSDTRPQGLDEPATGPLTPRAVLLLLPVVLVALAGIAIEDIGNNWAAVLLATERDVPISAAGIGLSVVLGAQFIGRVIGDRFIDRVGRRGALLASLTTGAAGLTLAAWAPSVLLTLAGLAIAGLGCAITVPLAFARADELPGLRPHTGVTWVGWAMRAATIGLTPAIGGLTTLGSLPMALSVVSLLAVIALAIQARTPRRTEHR